jgi:hypothetical protein
MSRRCGCGEPGVAGEGGVDGVDGANAVVAGADQVGAVAAVVGECGESAPVAGDGLMSFGALPAVKYAILLMAFPARDTAASAASTNDRRTGIRRNSEVWLKNTRRATTMTDIIPVATVHRETHHSGRASARHRITATHAPPVHRRSSSASSQRKRRDKSARSIHNGA